MQGNPSSIESFMENDQWLLVKIWKSDCGICAKAAPAMMDLDRMHEEIKLIGISIDGQSQEGKRRAQWFIDRFQLNFPNLLVDFLEFELFYLVLAQEPFRGTPTYILYNPMGQMMAVQPGILSPESILRFIEKNSPTQTPIQAPTQNNTEIPLAPEPVYETVYENSYEVSVDVQ